MSDHTVRSRERRFRRHEAAERPPLARRPLCIVLLAGVVLASVLAPFAAPTPAGADDPVPTPPAIVGQGCAPATGVTVVVDFTDESNTVELGCALGAQQDGFAALRNAGFGVNVDVPNATQGTVCTLDGVPEQGFPFCWTTGGYWSFWIASGVNAWTFSPVGAGGTGVLPVGSIQGWSWAGGFDGAAPRLAIEDLVDHDDPTPADAALAWTKRELADNGWALPGFSAGSIDVGLTIDALLALAAGGHRATPAADAVTDVVEANTTNYVSWAPTYPDVRVAGALSKALLAATIQGRDPSDFGGWDLDAELRALMQTEGPQTGRFSDHDPEFGSDASNGFGQALAILGLARTPGGVPDDAVRFLLAQQCVVTGFRVNYSGAPNCESAASADTDTTATTLQALLVAARTPEVKAALGTSLTWLLSQQDPTTKGFGGTGSTAGVNSNSTGLTTQGILAIGQTAVADQGAGWVASIQLLAANAGAAGSDLGAIAYNQGGFDTATSGGIGASNRDQWRRATVQALLAFGLPAVGSIGDPTPVAPVPPTNLDGFSDVPRTQAFHTDITWLVAAGITTGYGDRTYRPTTPVARQANAAFIYRLAGSPAFTPPAVPSFSDVPPTNAFYLEIEWMKAEGLTVGYSDGTFRPTGTVQRQAEASFLYRLAGSPSVPVDAPTFTDVPEGHAFHDAISWFAAVGVTNGFSDGTFRPTALVSRQAVAAFLHRFALLP